MIQRFNPKSEFSRNVLTLLTGTTIAQAIPIAITPILTRIYSPEDFGLFSLFFAIIAILGSIANGRYELAIMLPEKDEDAVNISALAILIALTFSGLLFILICIFNHQISNFIDREEISFWLYLVPFVVFFTGVFNVLNYLNTRKKNYKGIAKANVYKSISVAVVQLGIGYLKSGAAGLISGQFFGVLVANFFLVEKIRKIYLLKEVSWFQIIAMAKRYRDFPKFSMWSVLANSLAYNLTNIVISIYYSIATLGFYSLALKMLGTPSSLIGSSISQVYFQNAIIEKQNEGNSIKIFLKTLKKLVFISIVFFFPLYFLLPFVFGFVFGEEWRVAGEYAQILTPFFMARFISSPLSVSLSVFERNSWSLCINLYLLFITIVILISGFEFEMFLYVFSGVMCFSYIVFLFLYYRVVKNERDF